MTLIKNPKKIEKFPKYNRIIKKFFTENSLRKEIKQKKVITIIEKELENVNKAAQGPTLGKVSNQKTPSFISIIIFSNQNAKGAIPILKKENTITKEEGKKLKNQEKSNKREKSS
jgi:hypothetical protein